MLFISWTRYLCFTSLLESRHLSQSPYLPKVLWKEWILWLWNLSPQQGLIQGPSDRESSALTSQPPSLSAILSSISNSSMKGYLAFSMYTINAEGWRVCKVTPLTMSSMISWLSAGCMPLVVWYQYLHCVINILNWFTVMLNGILMRFNISSVWVQS